MGPRGIKKNFKLSKIALQAAAVPVKDVYFFFFWHFCLVRLEEGADEGEEGRDAVGDWEAAEWGEERRSPAESEEGDMARFMPSA